MTQPPSPAEPRDANQIRSGVVTHVVVGRGPPSAVTPKRYAAGAVKSATRQSRGNDMVRSRRPSTNASDNRVKPRVTSSSAPSGCSAK